MKVYVSADIEGITGIAEWEEARKDHADHPPFRERMTREVAAACEGALAAGADEVWVQDAHGSARNLVAEKLPEPVRLVRGWSGHPLGMVQALDATFAAVLFVGYHARAAAGGNPLAHTLHSGKVAWMTINGEPASEHLIHALAAATLGVPAPFLSGDEDICAEVARRLPAAVTVPVKQGVGASTISLHPDVALRRIREGAERALRGDLRACLLPLPERFACEIRFVNHKLAYKAGFYPGVERRDDFTIAMETGHYLDVLKLLLFTV